MIPVWTGWLTAFLVTITGRNFLNRIKDIAVNGALAVQRLTQRVDDASQHALADWNLKELTGCFHFGTLFDLGVFTQNDGSLPPILQGSGQGQ